MSDETKQVESTEKTEADQINAVYLEQMRATFEWALAATGERFMSFLFSCDAEGVQHLVAGQRQFSPSQLEVTLNLATLRGDIPSELDAGNTAEVLKNWLCQLTEEHPIAIKLREHIESIENIPAGQDDLEKALVVMARDTFPALLLPTEPDEIKIPFVDRNIRATRLIFSLPALKDFTAAVLQDARLKKIFDHDLPHAGRSAWIMRNTGRSETLQLLALPELLLFGAWRKIRDSEPSHAEFVEASLEELRLTRKLLAGQPCTIPVRVAFAGVLLPPGATLRVPNGAVRPVTAADRDTAPASLKHQLSGTDSSGTTTTINYDGDVVLEYEYSYALKAVAWTGDDNPRWPEEFSVADQGLEQTILRLRFSLMLAVQRPDFKAQLIPTWRLYDEPTQQGGGVSWYDPRQGAGLMPTQLTEDEAASWNEWFNRLSTAPVEKIELSLSRILKAIAERREPSDVLVDSVIAWENLFGTKDGEPVFRVTTCLAVLLENTLDKRKALKKDLGKIYTLRSDVVHGSKNLHPRDYPKCQEALDIAIRAIRTLTTTRTDILSLPDGALRSAELLMGNAVHETES